MRKRIILILSLLIVSGVFLNVQATKFQTKPECIASLVGRTSGKCASGSKVSRWDVYVYYESCTGKVWETTYGCDGGVSTRALNYDPCNGGTFKKLRDGYSVDVSIPTYIETLILNADLQTPGGNTGLFFYIDECIFRAVNPISQSEIDEANRAYQLFLNSGINLN